MTTETKLPNWGPYSKRYAGISHIPNISEGHRFDISVFAGIFRGELEIPNSCWHSKYHIRNATSDLTSYTYRQEITWKDQVYADITYSQITENKYNINCKLVNETSDDLSLCLHLMAYMEFVKNSAYTPLYPAIVTIPENGIWVDALDYSSLEFNTMRPTDSLCPDGRMRAEINESNLTNLRGIGQNFGNEIGDMVLYEGLPTKDFIEIRYKCENDISFKVEGLANQIIFFPKTNEFNVLRVKTDTHAPYLKLTCVKACTNGIILDGFGLTDDKSFIFTKKTWNTVPQIIYNNGDNHMLLKYDDIPYYYGISWPDQLFQIREIKSCDLENVMRFFVNEHVKPILIGTGEGHFTNLYIRPISVKATSKFNTNIFICSGTKEEVLDSLSCKYPYAIPNQTNNLFKSSEDGEKYLFSMQLLASTIFTNIVYPIYTQKKYIKHYAPGKWWDCLYTWDSGFVGLGMGELDLSLAKEILLSYLTENDPYRAFIHHGSPVPVQFYLFLDLLQKTNCKEFYYNNINKLKQYYDFLKGERGSSTTNKFKTNLLQSWDYFYNSGGWDDYPPQLYCHNNNLTNITTPVILTSHVIRCAKILKMLGEHFGNTEHNTEYEKDIAKLSSALHTYSWDETSGYFSYVMHDTNGAYKQKLTNEAGVNFNMGLDGMYPLVSGICTETQEKSLIDKIQDTSRLFSSAGLSAVDMTAPYFSKDGYWNGTVWMSHQWFFYKSMLDLGQTEFAFSIAKKALDVYSKETNRSYNTYEHFIIETGMGAGWHQFSGLSCPVVKWFKTYYCIGEVTTGFDTFIEDISFSDTRKEFSASFYNYSQDKNPSVVVTLNPSYQYNVTINGHITPHVKLTDCAIAFTLAKNTKLQKVEIAPYKQP